MFNYLNQPWFCVSDLKHYLESNWRKGLRGQHTSQTAIFRNVPGEGLVKFQSKTFHGRAVDIFGMYVLYGVIIHLASLILSPFCSCQKKCEVVW